MQDKGQGVSLARELPITLSTMHLLVKIHADPSLWVKHRSVQVLASRHRAVQESGYSQHAGSAQVCVRTGPICLHTGTGLMPTYALHRGMSHPKSQCKGMLCRNQGLPGCHTNMHLPAGTHTDPCFHKGQCGTGPSVKAPGIICLRRKTFRRSEGISISRKTPSFSTYWRYALRFPRVYIEVGEARHVLQKFEGLDPGNFPGSAELGPSSIKCTCQE